MDVFVDVFVVRIEFLSVIFESATSFLTGLEMPEKASKIKKSP